MSQPPFAATVELSDKLILGKDSSGNTVIRCKDSSAALPSHPQIKLYSPSIATFLLSEFVTPDLNTLSPYLWLVGTQSSKHISPLHHQLVKGRRLILTENPQLHLIWHSDQIFLKPLPEYALSYAFWSFYLDEANDGPSPLSKTERQELRLAMQGLLRTYALLIQHESDFQLAQRDEHRLLPPNISFPDFITFIENFANIPDMDVSPRYAGFGELRLSRLNLWSKVLLRRFTFQKVHHHYSDYFAQFYGPLLFAFATLSVVLSAMQVSVSVPQFVGAWVEWDAFGRAALWFAVSVQLCVTAVLLGLLALLIFMVSREAIFALKHLQRRKREVLREEQSRRKAFS